MDEKSFFIRVCCGLNRRYCNTRRGSGFLRDPVKDVQQNLDLFVAVRVSTTRDKAYGGRRKQGNWEDTHKRHLNGGTQKGLNYSN